MYFGVDLKRKIKAESIRDFSLLKYCREDSWFKIIESFSDEPILVVGDYDKLLIPIAKEVFKLHKVCSKYNIVKSLLVDDVETLTQHRL